MTLPSTQALFATESLTTSKPWTIHSEPRTVRCVCEAPNVQPSPDDHKDLLQCVQCENFQHRICIRVGESQRPSQANYRCQQCAPEDHQALITVLQQRQSGPSIAAASVPAMPPPQTVGDMKVQDKVELQALLRLNVDEEPGRSAWLVYGGRTPSETNDEILTRVREGLVLLTERLSLEEGLALAKKLKAADGDGKKIVSDIYEALMNLRVEPGELSGREANKVRKKFLLA